MSKKEADALPFHVHGSTSPFVSIETKGNAKKRKKSDNNKKESDNVNNDQYDMSGNKILIIFNHLKYLKTLDFGFIEPLERRGTEKDVAALKEIFEIKLGFRVIECNNYIHRRILETVWDVIQEDHSRTSCIAIAILTHGDRGGMLYAADKTYNMKTITTLLENSSNIHLTNKPKLLFVQACRGTLTDSGKIVCDDNGENVNSVLVPTHINFMQVHSSVEGYLSFRDTENGTPFIQTLCEVVGENYQYMDLLQIVTKTNNIIAYDPTIPKQTIETRFTLTKRLQF